MDAVLKAFGEFIALSAAFERRGSKLEDALQLMLNKAYKQNWNDGYPDVLAQAEAAIEESMDTASTPKPESHQQESYPVV